MPNWEYKKPEVRAPAALVVENIPHVQADIVDQVLVAKPLVPTRTTDGVQVAKVLSIDGAPSATITPVAEVPQIIVQTPKFIKQNPAYVKSLGGTKKVEPVPIPRKVTTRQLELAAAPPPPILQSEMRSARKKLKPKNGPNMTFRVLREKRQLATKIAHKTGISVIWDNFQSLKLIRTGDYTYIQVSIAARDGVKLLVLTSVEYVLNIDEFVPVHVVTIPMTKPSYQAGKTLNPLVELLDVLADVPQELYELSIYDENNMVFSAKKEKYSAKHYKNFLTESKSTSFLTTIDTQRNRKRDEDEETVSTARVLRWGDYNSRQLLGLGERQDTGEEHSAGDNSTGNRVPRAIAVEYLQDG